VNSDLWERSLERLQSELSEQQLNTWIRPLQAVEGEGQLRLLAPNRFVLDWVKTHFYDELQASVRAMAEDPELELVLEVGSQKRPARSRPAPKPSRPSQPTQPAQPAQPAPPRQPSRPAPPPRARQEEAESDQETPVRHNLNPHFTFDSYVEGKSNQIARAASMQVAEHPGAGYNPLLIYGGVGLGKTHLMHAAGNRILQEQPDARVIYLHSERFVAEMIRALQHNAIDEFKNFYRSVNALLIDDIQFFAGKERSQEEFFHTFNALMEGGQQIIMTCDRYPKEIEGLEERLKSRFGWGLTVAIEPPELETRVAILQSKAEQTKVELPSEVAFFIAKRIRSNIRELEGALKRVLAQARFTGRSITLDFAKEALKDLIALQDKLVTIENIQKTVADYYKIRVSDLLSSRRSRSITRPRQLSMALAKELTSHSLPEIGNAFGGRDHTTVLHACRKVNELRESDNRIGEDYANLLRTLTS